MADMETQLTPQMPMGGERDHDESVTREVDRLHDVGLKCNCGIMARTSPLRSR